ncbi:MAG: hypothetical protein CMJ34_01870 [Phycisphaerae bacterium]|nr:hypothetical protein [Phycisphaerae bacterium]
MPAESDRQLLRLRSWTKDGHRTRRWLVLEVAMADDRDWSMLEPVIEKIPASTAVPQLADGDGNIAYIPMKGDVGLMPDSTDGFFSADDFNRAIKSGIDAGVDTFILGIDTDGGRLDTAIRCQEIILRQIHRDCRFFALVEQRAISAGALIALGCEHWFVTPEARVGASVTWAEVEGVPTSLQKQYLDDPDLLAKRMAYLMALTNECCLIHGRDPSLGQAMTSMEPELWWAPGHGFSEERHAAAAEKLDNDRTVLAITASRIARTRLGSTIDDASEAFSLLAGTDPEILDLSSEMDRTWQVAESLRSKLQAGEELTPEENTLWLQLLNTP